MLILTGRDVCQVLEGNEPQILDAIREAYIQHSGGTTSLPHSVFLRFPDNERDRIIALPAYLGGAAPVAGVKWIASFPANVQHGIERASAAIIMNSPINGRPEVMLEGSVISARRTGASAALAASLLSAPADAAGVTIIGCGVINFEVLRFLLHVYPNLAEATLFDANEGNAESFAERCSRTFPALRILIEPDRTSALAAHTLVSIATTATTPYLETSALPPGSLILHMSLRDVLPQAIVKSVNIVDDADHVCRAGTSLELAERITGDRSFITTEIGDLAAMQRPLPRDPVRTTVFSPFGLGVLDLAVARVVLNGAQKERLGVQIDDFFPAQNVSTPRERALPQSPAPR